ncbi:putative gamma-glutamylcyclotransferase At3g02910 [Phalaenopsis equestris]|uniref:putative gamma-glutamylcyclotransferase At3g02910 n=1 Tax=Phalaenopsis equestris TaxID=78828 RepID=UPI0009E2B08C|nr:putative gamma-glutamylcyclotransferase At3g02910 [Phalaenopsis equestris]
MGAATADNDQAVIFTYGTLKQGFYNHRLIQDMILAGDAAFLGIALTADRYPLVCGPYRVPFLINIPGAGELVSGELYAVSRRAIALVDELEGISRGHYERLPITVRLPIGGEEGGEEGLVVEAEAYFAHQSFGEKMWRRNGEKGICAYSSDEAVGYVKRKDRPQEITFLDQIRIFVSSTMD